MRRLAEFVRDSGGWGLTSEITALVLFVIAFWEHSHDKSVTAFTLLVVSVPLFWVGAFIAWAKKNKRLEEIEKAKPRITLSGPDAIHILPNVFQTYNNVQQGPVPFLLVRFVNEPQGPYPSAKANDVRATITYHRDSDNNYLFSMDGRWSDSDQPSAVNPLKSKSHLLATTFGIGQKHDLDIAYRDAQTRKYFAWNNDNYDHPFFRCDEHLLIGDRFRVDIRLLGEWVDERFSFKFRTTDTGFVLEEKGRQRERNSN